MEIQKKRDTPVSVRLEWGTYQRLKAASRKGRYPPTVTDIIRRGVDLALNELERGRPREKK